MKVTEKVKEEMTKENVIEVTCDWCKKKFDDLTVECEGYGNVSVSFGYGSIRDEETCEGEICDECFLKYLSPNNN